LRAEAPPPARSIEGRTPKKNALSFFRKKSGARKSEKQGTFFFGVAERSEAVAGRLSERTIQSKVTTRAERTTSFVLEIGSNLVQ